MTSQLQILVPATGRSQRMGTHKLLIEVGNRTVIEHLLNTLADAYGWAAIAVSCRPEDVALQHRLQRLGPLRLVIPNPAPVDMRASVEQLVESVGRAPEKPTVTGWMLIPADHPVVEPTVLQRLDEAHREHREGIVVPVHQGR
ncbi:MAG: NTP transferase domain-containing protein, partial [Planctomycetaceae bacterium]|nr:NTP transferase domain-containing protein [Planctomycetaceae bacterium]